MSAREILSTPRLTLREMDEGDFDALCAILQDETVMAAYAHAFSDQEVRAWLQNQRRRYARYGFGLWAMLEKETGDMIGQCGLSMQKTPEREVLEVGYLLRRDRWGHGLATEAARACRDYAFDVLGAREVFSIIRDNNLASQRVALRNGMRPCGGFVKHYWGVDMPHIVFCVRRESRDAPEPGG